MTENYIYLRIYYSSIIIAKAFSEPKVTFDEKTFRWEFNEDAMATEKLSEGIRNFAKDAVKLKSQLKNTLSN